MLSRTIQTRRIIAPKPRPTRHKTHDTLLIRSQQAPERQPRHLEWMIYVDLHGLVPLLFLVVPEVRPWRLEDAGAGDVDVRDGGEVLDGGSVERGEVGPGCHVAFLELDRGGVRRDEGFGVGGQFKVADQDAGAEGMGEFGEGEADAWGSNVSLGEDFQNGSSGL